MNKKMVCGRGWKLSPLYTINYFVRYGFYGPTSEQHEGGEALIVADKEEA